MVHSSDEPAASEVIDRLAPRFSCTTDANPDRRSKITDRMHRPDIAAPTGPAVRAAGLGAGAGVTTLQLETSRLILRPAVEADLDGWAAFDSDVQATEFFGGPKSRAASWEFLATAAGMWALRGCGMFSVIEKNSASLIGRIGPWKPEGANAEVGWAILPSMWGKGYATEGAEAAIDWTIANLGWTEINHCIDAENSASTAVALRLGAKWLRADHDAHGKVTQVYGQTSQQWRSR